jgi:hypothetical protein
VQPWPGEVLEERAGEIAVGFAALLTRQVAWRHRRVETIDVLSHEQVRRSVSVDFTVPLEHRADLQLADGQYAVPLGVLEKRQLVHFDLRSEDEESVPLMRSEEVQLIARELLYLLVDLDVDDGDPPEVSDLIERVLAAGPQDAEAVGAQVDAVAVCPGSPRSPVRSRAAFCCAPCCATSRAGGSSSSPTTSRSSGPGAGSTSTARRGARRRRATTSSSRSRKVCGRAAWT